MMHSFLFFRWYFRTVTKDWWVPPEIKLFILASKQLECGNYLVPQHLTKEQICRQSGKQYLSLKQRITWHKCGILDVPVVKVISSTNIPTQKKLFSKIHIGEKDTDHNNNYKLSTLGWSVLCIHYYKWLCLDVKLHHKYFSIISSRTRNSLKNDILYLSKIIQDGQDSLNIYGL